jgi:hypothetical protein
MTKKKTAKKKRKVKAGGRRRTSDRVSRIAGRVLRWLGDAPASSAIWFEGVRITVGQVRSLAASCLAQDEHRGIRGKR